MKSKHTPHNICLFFYLACVLLVISAAGSGCGYKMVGSRGATSKIFVDIFENKTLEPGLEARVTSWVKDELVNSAGFTIENTKDNADYVVYGTIVSLSESTISISSARRASEMRFTISFDVTLVDTKTNRKTRLTNKAFSGDYAVSGDIPVDRTAKNRAAGRTIISFSRFLAVWLQGNI